MLRYQARKQVSLPFVCWRCLSRAHRSPGIGSQKVGFGVRPQENGRTNVSRRHLSTGRAKYTAVEAGSVTLHDLDLPPPKSSEQLNIRDRLRQWEAENIAPPVEEHPLALDRPQLGDIHNNLVRPLDAAFDFDTRPDGADPDEELEWSYANGSEAVDVERDRPFLQAGDLAELRSSSRQQELAIYVREFETNGQAEFQFYSQSGRWAHVTASKPSFVVKRFVEPHELDVLRPYLPQSGVAATAQDKLQNFDNSLPRAIGRRLLTKMRKFLVEADAAYQEHAAVLDNASEIIHKSCNRLSLEKIANTLLSRTAKPDGSIQGQISTQSQTKTWPMPVLYAVHRSLLENDVAFRLAMQYGLRRIPEYEVTPLKDIKEYMLVTKDVRAHQLSVEKAKLNTQLEQFAKHARRLIDHSRETREFIPHGALGPYSKPSTASGVVLEAFDAGESNAWFLRFGRFLEAWAGDARFSSHTHYNGVGSAILRAIDRYDNVPLDRSTAWVCLHELGLLPPWASQPRYRLRIGNQITDKEISYRPPPSPLHKSEDKLKDLRRDWGALPVYCIDDAIASEIDDGISLEGTESPDEYWIHIHVADPASHIDPDDPAGVAALNRVETVYFPEATFPLLHPEYVQSHLSLASGRPCLTFSARMNTNGELLDSRVEPGVVRNVNYLSPAVLDAVATDAPASEETVYTTGTDHLHPQTGAQGRRMLEPNDITEEHRANLNILQTIASARARTLEQRGGISSGYLRPRIDVSLHGVHWKQTEIRALLNSEPQSREAKLGNFGDPSIRISVPTIIDPKASSYVETKPGFVGTFMVLAGEIGARWCHARGIPVPFRSTIENPEARAQRDLFRKSMLPLVDEGHWPIDIFRRYLRVIGLVSTSSTAGYHAGMGVDMFIKCSSPLRRISDLIAHWQIGGALLEEARTGKSLIGNTLDDFLPFSKDDLDTYLPRMINQEKAIKKNAKDVERLWLLRFLLYAWKYGTPEIPSRFMCEVTALMPGQNLVQCFVLKFLTVAVMAPPPGVGIEHVKVGDRYEVMIKDIHVHDKARFEVAPVRFLSSAEQRANSDAQEL